MMKLKKALTPDQISDVEELGRIKQELPAEKWILFRTLLLTYISGIEVGLSLEKESVQ